MFRPPFTSLLLALCASTLLACPPSELCGNGALDPGEACDPTDTAGAPALCRDDCTIVRCGDGVHDEGEACDDGNPWGGDGCNPWCEAESGTFETEPNDSADAAEPLTGPGTVNGRLLAGDRDCFAFDVPAGAAVSAAIEPSGGGAACAHEAVVELWSPEGERVIAGLPTLDAPCASIDPAVETFARYLDAGAWSVCITGVFGEQIPGYALGIELFDSCADLPPLTPDPSQDGDRDGSADLCDADDDNDGIDDSIDNCPNTPNGPAQPFPFDTSDEGFVRLWLLLGPFTSGATPGGCEPAPDSFAGLPTDADAAPMIGDTASGISWRAHLRSPDDSAVVRFTDYWTPAAPREAYAATWVYSPEQRAAELAVGVDDGDRILLNGEEVGLVSGCQGVSADRFVFDVTLEAGWNRLLHKVYDGGGGWGMITRFRWPDDTPMTDLGLSIGGPSDWLDNQGDLDGDGLGDVCDPDPANP